MSKKACEILPGGIIAFRGHYIAVSQIKYWFDQAQERTNQDGTVSMVYRIDLHLDNDICLYLEIPPEEFAKLYFEAMQALKRCQP